MTAKESKALLRRRLTEDPDPGRPSASPSSFSEIAARLKGGESPAAVAEDLNVQEHSVSRLTDDERFLELYDALKERAMDKAEERISKSADDAAALLETAVPFAAATQMLLLDDPDAGIRLRASKAILETAGVQGRRGPVLNINADVVDVKVLAHLEAGLHDLFGINLNFPEAEVSDG